MQANAINRNDRREAGTPETVAETVADVVELGQRDQRDIGFSERFAHMVTLFSGSMAFVWLHVAWFAGWIVLNLSWLGVRSFDKFPFTFLTMLVSLEAIFLSTFVLITQNRQSRESERRAKVDLQVNMIAEREITEVIRLLRGIHEHLGIEQADGGKLDEMLQQTQIQQLAEETDAAESGKQGALPTAKQDSRER